MKIHILIYNYFAQNMGVRITSKVNISKRPKSIAKASTPFVKELMLEQFSETTPRPGPRLFKHAPTAENADSKSKPETKVINKRITKEITYIEKKPQTDVAT